MVFTKLGIGAMTSRAYDVASCRMMVGTPSAAQLSIPASVVGNVVLRATCRIPRTLVSLLLGGLLMVIMIVAVVLVAHGVVGTYIVAGTSARIANHIMLGGFARRTTSFTVATITGIMWNATLITMTVVGVRCLLLVLAVPVVRSTTEDMTGADSC